MPADGDELDRGYAIEPIKRAPVLRRLSRGPAPRDELQEALGVSKATLHRIVTGFADDGLVEETDAGVRLTGTGRAVADAVDAYLDRMVAASRLEPLLNGLPPAVELDVEQFADAEVVTPTPGQPQRPVQRVVDFVEEADTLRATGAVVLPIYVEVLYREINDGMETELVVSPSVIEALQEEYPRQLAEVLDRGVLSLLVHDDVDVGLALDGDRALVVGSEAGVAKVAVIADRPPVVEWAEAAFARLRREAAPYEEVG